MKAWLFIVAVLFVLAEFSLWLKNFMLPLPIYVFGGAFLAIASNYEKGIMALFRQQLTSKPEAISETATLVKEPQTIKAEQQSSLPATKTDN